MRDFHLQSVTVVCLEKQEERSQRLGGNKKKLVSITLMIFCKFLQVSSRASIVNQVYGLEATRKLLIWRSSSANWLKSAWAELSEERKASWASRRALISSSELQRTGSVRSSSAFSNQLLKADAFFAKVRNRSSTLERKDHPHVQLHGNSN